MSADSTEENAAPDLGLVTFVIGDARFAFEVSSVVEVVSPLALTPLFGLREHVLGVMNLRGRVLPVSRLGDLLGRDSLSHPLLGLRVRLAAAEAIFAVDRVLTVEWTSSSRLVEPPPAAGQTTEGFHRAILPIDPPVTVLELARLLDGSLWNAAPESKVA